METATPAITPPSMPTTERGGTVMTGHSPAGEPRAAGAGLGGTGVRVAQCRRRAGTAAVRRPGGWVPVSGRVATGRVRGRRDSASPGRGSVLIGQRRRTGSRRHSDLAAGPRPSSGPGLSVARPRAVAVEPPAPQPAVHHRGRGRTVGAGRRRGRPRPAGPAGCSEPRVCPPTSAEAGQRSGDGGDPEHGRRHRAGADQGDPGAATGAAGLLDRSRSRPRRRPRGPGRAASGPARSEGPSARGRPRDMRELPLDPALVLDQPAARRAVLDVGPGPLGGLVVELAVDERADRRAEVTARSAGPSRVAPRPSGHLGVSRRRRGSAGPE